MVLLSARLCRLRPDITVSGDDLHDPFIDFALALIVEVLSPSAPENDRTAHPRSDVNQVGEVCVMADSDRQPGHGPVLRFPFDEIIPARLSHLHRKR